MTPSPIKMMSLLWDEPVGPVRAAVIVQHGFARAPQRLAGIAGLLAARGLLVVRPRVPSLRPRHSLQDSRWLDDLGREIISQIRRRAGDRPIIGVGHSAGAAVVSGWSADLAGLILLDPVDRHGRIADLARADARNDVPLRVISADPSGCNRHGRAAESLAAAGRIEAGTTWVTIEHTAHQDPERIPASLEPADVADDDLLARWACGRGGTSERVCRWGHRLVEDIEAFLPM